MISAGKAEAGDYQVEQTLRELVQPAIDEALRQRPDPASVVVRIWASPLVVDVRYPENPEGQRLALRVFVVVDARVGVALAEFLTAGVNRLPARDRLQVVGMTSKNSLSLAAELDVTFGGSLGVVMSLDEQHRVELFQLTERPH